MFVKRISLVKQENGAAIRIPKLILEELNIDSNNYENIGFSVKIEGGKLIFGFNGAKFFSIF